MQTEVTKKSTLDQPTGSTSYFDGSTWQRIGYLLLSALVSAITLGIAYPWMLCMLQRWKARHTVINGRRLKFTGRGHQLIGRYLLWVFLTLITLGIYGIWLGLGMKKWVVKHTVYADDDPGPDSYFSGGAGGYLGIHILCALLTMFTLGIGMAWANKMRMKWEAKHTHIGGSPLVFHGTGGQLFLKYLLLVVLTPFTLGIYALFFPVSLLKWQAKNTDAVYQTPEIQAKARAHEQKAVSDYAKFRLAANDQEIAAMKSGYTGQEDPQALAQMAEAGNPFAAYRMAVSLRGDSPVYEGLALALLRQAADAKLHFALLELAKQLPAGEKCSVLTEAAQHGNGEACWLLAVEYQQANDLAQAAYWFRLALEWERPEAVANVGAYDKLIRSIALQLSENHPPKRGGKALGIVLGIVAGVIVLAVAAGAAMWLLGYWPTARAMDTAAESTAVVYRTIPAEWVTGQTCTVDGITYVLGSEAFYDWSTDRLYVAFAVLDAPEHTAIDVESAQVYDGYGEAQGCIVEIAGWQDWITVYDGSAHEQPVATRYDQQSAEDTRPVLGHHELAGLEVVHGDSLDLEAWLSAMQTEEFLLGTWYWNGMNNDMLEELEFIFGADGTYSYTFRIYLLPDVYYEWYGVNPENYETLYGTEWGMDSEDVYSGTYVLDTDTLTVELSHENSMTLTDEGTLVWKNHSMELKKVETHADYYNEEVENYLASFGDAAVSTPAGSEVTAADIVGSWQQYRTETRTYWDVDGVSHTGEGIWQTSWSFREDGSYSYRSFFYAPASEAAYDLLYYDGKYWEGTADAWGEDGNYTVSDSVFAAEWAAYDEASGKITYHTLELVSDVLYIDGEAFIRTE